MSIERDTVVFLIYVSISLVSESIPLVELIRYTSITSTEENINNRSIKSKSPLMNKDIVRRIVQEVVQAVATQFAVARNRDSVSSDNSSQLDAITSLE